jgi:hypothetical protein
MMNIYSYLERRPPEKCRCNGINAVRVIGIEDKIGAYTLRKTFGYHAYKSVASMEVIKNCLITQRLRRR